MEQGKKYLIVAPFPYDFSNKNFKDVYIGDPLRGLLGRGMTAAITAFERKADVVAFGGGVLVGGEHESFFEQKKLLDSLGLFQELLPDKVEKIFDFISRHSVVDLDKKNDDTYKVAEWLCELALEKMATRPCPTRIEICIITDPAHLRPIQLVSWWLKNFRKEIKISVVLSDIPYSNEKMTIIEGPLNKIIGDQVGVLIANNKQTAKEET